jgi:hypothetical protein
MLLATKRRPRRESGAERWLEAFDTISLAEVRKAAKATRMILLRAAVATLLCERLEAELGPSRASKPPRIKRETKPVRSISRIPEIQAQIEVGRQLLELRANIPNNREFGRLLRRQFDMDQKSASEAMRVARAYGGRPEITSHLSWEALLQISSPALSPTTRQRFETRILAGENIKGVTIKRARGRLPSGRPRQERAASPVQKLNLKRYTRDDRLLEIEGQHAHRQN